MNRSSPLIEKLAAAIYAQMEYSGEGTKPAWQARGNSHKQDEARVYARTALDELRDFIFLELTA